MTDSTPPVGGHTPGPWRPIAEAPRDLTPILAITGEIDDERYSHWSHRMFVVFHLGTTARLGVDMGWSLFPGMVVGDEWLAAWMPLPEPPTKATGVHPHE